LVERKLIFIKTHKFAAWVNWKNTIQQFWSTTHLSRMMEQFYDGPKTVYTYYMGPSMVLFYGTIKPILKDILIQKNKISCWSVILCFWFVFLRLDCPVLIGHSLTFMIILYLLNHIVFLLLLSSYIGNNYTDAFDLQ
jgi:hypothetical protein